LALTDPGAPQPSGTDDEWLTPPEIAEGLDKIGVAFDPCWAPGTLYHPALFADIRAGHDGLLLPWEDADGLVYFNPPYSDISPWLKKAHEASAAGAHVLGLVPAKLELAAFHDHVFAANTKILAIRSRLRFHRMQPDGTTKKLGNGRFASVLIEWYPYHANVHETFAHLGTWLGKAP
jgi:DNA (cytosine-5)-methyltransferase 1